MTSITLLVTKSPDPALALTNKVYLHHEDHRVLTGRNPQRPFVIINNQWVFSAEAHAALERGKIALSSNQRTLLKASLNQPVEVTAFVLDEFSNTFISSIDVAVAFNKKQPPREYDVKDLETAILANLELQILTMDQVFLLDVHGETLKFKVVKLEVVDLKYFRSKEKGDINAANLVSVGLRGLLTKKSEFCFSKGNDSTIILKGAASNSRRAIFRPDWNFENMGIGGLDTEFSDIFRRAFASRVFPPEVIKQLGINHVRGILLHGPPGTGKTLMARQIGKMLNGREPKIVNGPEILNKYVGQSEENIRKLFIDAEREQAQRGDESDLHIIIFDEIDAICKTRGTVQSGTGVNDSVVNQLLSKIDGVDRLNNVLLIGMTNRIDMIDEALLRPGRLEVHMQIPLPNEQGRLQIFRIHTAAMRESNRMAPDVSLEELAGVTKNYTGAEIEGIVKSSSSFALNRCLDPTNLSKPIDTNSVIVTRDDFLNALSEVKPAFGVTDSEFDSIIENGIIPYGASFQKIMRAGQLFSQQVHTSARTRLVSVLLDGKTGTGKSAIAAKIALDGQFPFVKLISPEMLVGYSESAKSSKIQKVFEDAYKSPISVIVVDDIERLLDYVPIGPRFSNAVLQTLLVLIKKVPPEGRRLMVIGTTSNTDLLVQMDMLSAFNATLTVEPVKPGDETRTVLDELHLFTPSELDSVCSNIQTPVPVKRLLMIAEMAKHGEGGTIADRFNQCINDYVFSTL